jgi:hypothetical protein
MEDRTLIKCTQQDRICERRPKEMDQNVKHMGSIAHT